MAEPPLSIFNRPIVGDTLKFLSSPALWSRELSKRGDVVKAYIRGIDGLKMSTVYHLSGVEGLKAFYDEKNVARGSIDTPPDPYLFDNYLFVVPKLNLEAHKIRKGILLQVVHSPENIDRFIETIVSLSQGFIETLSAKIKDGKLAKIPLNTAIRQFTARFTAKYLWSYDDADGIFIRKQYEAINDISSVPLKLPFFAYNDGIKIAKWLREFSYSRLAEHRLEPDKYNDTMKLLMNAVPRLTDEELILELNHLLFAINGLSSTATGAIIKLLQHKNTEIYGKVTAEIENNRELLESFNNNQSINGKKIDEKFPYLLNVIRESLRLYPVAPMQLANSVREFQVEGYKIPKDVIVIGAIYGNGFDPKLYPDSEEFRPERFEHEITNTTSGYEYSSFGAGDISTSHRCAGQPAALSYCVYIIARLLAKFEISLVDSNQSFSWTTAFPRPVNECPVEIKFKS
ncbi:947_t:CDS:2 [Ambispora gerdemannii]|uniref:947_t:CDS:1 n=1 Tax=Ambispora gerdemannii TaxID=144530 RepID=A0A9N9CKZ1_9GLOM|nr:947_t:CDS:2 [Ambispora gerdemannii]